MKRISFYDRIWSPWLVFIIDQFILMTAVLVSVFIQQSVNFQEVFTGKIIICLSIYNLIAAAVFIPMKLHTGIVRYSSVVDVWRVFNAVLLVSLLSELIIGLILAPYLNIIHHWLSSVLIINFFISATALVVMRITVKLSYHYLEDLQMAGKEALLIYGADSSSLLIKHGLDASRERNFKLLGFIDDHQSKKNKMIEQKQVYGSAAIPGLKSKFGVQKMIVLEQCADMEGRKRAVEICIEQGIRVISVPASSHWLNGKLILSKLPEFKIEDLLQRKSIKLDRTWVCKGISGKRVLVSGAAGSIGSEIVRQILACDPAMVILCDQAETPLHDMQLEIREHFKGSICKFFIVSMCNYDRLKQIFERWRPEVVYHAAALKHVPMMESNPAEAIRTNILGTRYLADLSVLYGVDNFVMISTDKAVNPTNVMGASKRIAEVYIQSLHSMQETGTAHTKFITTRFGNVLGSNGSVIPHFRNQIARGGPVTVTHPDINRYFMTIDEAVQLVLEASVMGKGGEIFIFDMGKPVKILDLAVSMIKLAGYLPYSDIQILFTGLRPGEKLYEELLNDTELVLPTYHEKIKIANVMFYPYHYVCSHVDHLLSLLNEGDNDALLIKKMQEIIPEYRSNNQLVTEVSEIQA
ncbi:MAG: nucleoside-diphosphate sugar epimerase/dehydratase [Pedobacter sp.]|uniref:polysaccharide biosynthesis protein n=1 Tax=Pedobacter sp. TaxID=1411316 RepID=UPI00339470EE